MADAERGYRLLIVDDDEIDQALYRRLLTRPVSGAAEVQHATDGAAGLAMLRANAYDCVLLDFSLPDMTGLEFLEDACADRGLPCAVVLVTGHGNEAVAVEAMKRGAQDYLVKDKVDANTLWRAITGAVTQTTLRQRLAGSVHALTAANAALAQEVVTRTAAELALRRAKEIAEQANQAKTRFVAMVTHELRTPLNGILGYAQLLRMEGGLRARQTAHVGAMMKAGQHLLEMIEQVLDFACLETSGMALSNAPVAIGALTEGCIGFIAPLATERGLSLRLISAHDAPREIVMDPVRLRQVVLNLLGNAVKYTTTGGVELRVLAGGTAGGVRLEIADTGPGIDDAERERLFRDFERLDATPSVEGAGLGLAIAARIVSRMGGTIGHTPNPTGGSVFWLDLPPGIDGPAVVPEIIPAVPSPRAAGRRVLLVDDMAMNRDIIGAFLGTDGHAVTLADTGQDAMRLAAAQTFDLILMDVRMPEMDGLEATRQIRALPAPHGTVPILALTACAFREQVEQCRAAGMDGHVAKPVDFAVLGRVIAETIAGGSRSWGSNQHAPGLQPPRLMLDRTALDQTLAYLSPDEAAAHLRSLRLRNEQILLLLGQTVAPGVLADAAHQLASAAGMFGFAAQEAAARGLERALARGAPGIDGLGQRVCEETRVALTVLDQVIREARLQPA